MANINCSVPADMVCIPGGPFTIGSSRPPPEDAPASERPLPAKEVNLSPYAMDRYEVTQKDYAQFIEKTKPDAGQYIAVDRNGNTVARGTLQSEVLKSGKKRDPQARVVQIPQGRTPLSKGTLPQTHVSFFDAEAYCALQGKRLPEEEEWEKAAKGPRIDVSGHLKTHPNESFDSLTLWLDNFQTEDSTLLTVEQAQKAFQKNIKIFAYNQYATVSGRLDPREAIFSRMSNPQDPSTLIVSTPVPVQQSGCHERFGKDKKICGMTGNAGEWTAGLAVKGGSAANFAKEALQTSARMILDPTVKANNIGLRCAKSLDPLKSKI